MKKKTLRHYAPHEFYTDFHDTPAYQYLDEEVVKEHDGCIDGWIGKHKNVYVWWELANGKAVGWNENPARGWSFPVATLTKRCA